LCMATAAAGRGSCSLRTSERWRPARSCGRQSTRPGRAGGKAQWGTQRIAAAARRRPPPCRAAMASAVAQLRALGAECWAPRSWANTAGGR
jgi:hypothetical protein